MVRTKQTTAEQAMVAKAKAMAKKLKLLHCVIEIDEADERKLWVVRESYLHTDEFYAFDGVLFFTVYPNGEVE